MSHFKINQMSVYWLGFDLVNTTKYISEDNTLNEMYNLFVPVLSDGEKKVRYKTFPAYVRRNVVARTIGKWLCILCVSLAVCWRSHLFICFFVILCNCFFISKTSCTASKDNAIHSLSISRWYLISRLFFYFKSFISSRDIV